VIDKKPPTMPYSKVLVVYVEEACDLTMFDSLTYNICLRSCFLNGDNYEMRSQMEEQLSQQLTTATVIVKSTDILDIYNNSYDYFRHVIDSLHIDALLVVDFRHYGKTLHESPQVMHNVGNTDRVYMSGGTRYSTLNSDYVCYLMKASSLNFPIWTAALGTKGHAGAGKFQLNNKMAKTLAKELKSEGYWMH
jgi:hypothetical protein